MEQNVVHGHRVGARHFCLARDVDGDQLLVIEVGDPKSLSPDVHVDVADAGTAYPVANHLWVVMVGRSHSIAGNIGGPHINSQLCQVEKPFRRIVVAQRHAVDPTKPQRPKLYRALDRCSDQEGALRFVRRHAPDRTHIGPGGLNQIVAGADTLRPILVADDEVTVGRLAAW